MSDRPQRRSYDVVVVGARVAGSITAALMAKAGLSVLIVDRAQFPSPTLSTHYFRGAHLLRVIERIGALEDARAVGSPALTHDYDHSPAAGSVDRAPAEGAGAIGYCMSIRRLRLDALLLDCARGAGAEVLTGQRMSGVSLEGDRAVGVELGDGLEVAADLVVGADGIRSQVARSVRADDRQRHRGMRALYFRYVAAMPGPQGASVDGAEFSLLGDELVYVFPSDAGLTCVAISVNLDAYERIRHDAHGGFEDQLRSHGDVWARYADAEPRSRVYGWGPHDDFVRAAAGPGWALVGDAGLHQDPWTGRGMDSAGLSAEALADAVVAVGTDSIAAVAEPLPAIPRRQPARLVR